MGRYNYYHVDKASYKEYTPNMNTEKESHDVSIGSAENGYVVTAGKNTYVFPTLPAALDWMEKTMPTAQEAKKALENIKNKKKNKSTPFKWDDIITEMQKYGGDPALEKTYVPYGSPKIGTIPPPMWTTTSTEIYDQGIMSNKQMSEEDGI